MEKVKAWFLIGLASILEAARPNRLHATVPQEATPLVSLIHFVILVSPHFIGSQVGRPKFIIKSDTYKEAKHQRPRTTGIQPIVYAPGRSFQMSDPPATTLPYKFTTLNKCVSATSSMDLTVLSIRVIQSSSPRLSSFNLLIPLLTPSLVIWSLCSAFVENDYTSLRSRPSHLQLSLSHTQDNWLKARIQGKWPIGMTSKNDVNCRIIKTRNSYHQCQGNQFDKT